MFKRPYMFFMILIILSIQIIRSKFSDIMNSIYNDDNDNLKLMLKHNEEFIDLPQAGGGQTPLMYATLNGKFDIVKTLLEAGASTSIGEENGYTPIHGAGFQGRAEVVPLLISYGMNPNERHTDGYTPLHRACWGKEERHTETVKAFLNAGVKMNQKAIDGKTCYSMTNNKATKNYLKNLQTKHKEL